MHYSLAVCHVTVDKKVNPPTQPRRPFVDLWLSTSPYVGSVVPLDRYGHPPLWCHKLAVCQLLWAEQSVRVYTFVSYICIFNVDIRK